MGTESAPRIILLIDFDNMAISANEANLGRFDFGAVMAALRDRGRVLVKRAYADWNRWESYQRAMNEHAVEMIHLPAHKGSNKNMADICLAVDAMEYVFQTPHLDTYILLSGDSDLSPLVTKLRQNGKYVLTIGVKAASSALLIGNSDEFISYESIVGATGDKDPQEAYQLLWDTIRSVDLPKVPLTSLKNFVLQKDPSFNEKEYGYRQFKGLVFEAVRAGWLISEEEQGRILLDAPDRPGKRTTTKKPARKKRSPRTRKAKTA